MKHTISEHLDELQELTNDQLIDEMSHLAIETQLAFKTYAYSARTSNENKRRNAIDALKEIHQRTEALMQTI